MGGHLRVKAAQKLGLDTAPVLLADEMAAVQIPKYWDGIVKHWQDFTGQKATLEAAPEAHQVRTASTDTEARSPSAAKVASN